MRPSPALFILRMLAKLRLPASDRLAPLITAIVWLLVIGLIALLAAHWYWRIAGPAVESPRHASTTDAAAAAADVAARQLFGVYVVEASEPAAQTVQSSRFKLLGVMANSGNTRGFAILQENEQAPITVIEGDEFQPGLRLLRVLPDGVEIGQGESRERIAFSPAISNAAQNGVIPVAPALAPPTAPGTGVAPPPPPQAPPGSMRRLNAPPLENPAPPTEQPPAD